jgi:hypothetical protein
MSASRENQEETGLQDNRDQVPDDGQEPKPVAQEGPRNPATSTPTRAITASTSHVTENPTSSAKKARRPTNHFSPQDDYLIALTHFHCSKNGAPEWTPWNKVPWTNYGPKLLLDRHPVDSIRRRWVNVFGLFEKRDEFIREALIWTGDDLFAELARKHEKTSPLLIRLANKHKKNLEYQDEILKKLDGKGSPWVCSDQLRALETERRNKRGMSRLVGIRLGLVRK